MDRTPNFNLAIPDENSDAKVIDTLKENFQTIDKVLNETIEYVGEQTADVNTQLETNAAIKYSDIGHSSSSINHKLFYKADNNECRVISRKPDGNGYILMRFRKGRGAAADSANYGVSWDLLRLDRVDHLSEVVVFNQPENYTSSQFFTTGENDFRIQSFNTFYTFPTFRNFISNSGREKQGAFLEFNTMITKQHKGWLYLGFYGTSGANKNVSVYVDDEFLAIVDTSLPSAGLKTIAFDLGTKLGNIKVRLQAANDATAARSIHFLGANMMNLNEVVENLDFNGAIWRDKGTPYISQSSGANDYAFIESASGKWAGSYHGGETLKSSTMFLDGISLDGLSADSYRVGKSFTLLQTTDIIGKVESQTITRVVNDGTFHFDVNMVVPQPFEVTDFYVAMTCTNNDFNEVIYPRKVSLSAGNHTAYLPNAKRVIQRKPITNQMITTVYSPLSNYQTNTSPLFVQWSQYYSKVYHGLAQGKPRLFNSMNFGTVKIFD